MGELVVVTGPPGAGKSTVSELLTDGTADPVSLDGRIGRGVADRSLRYRPA